MKGLVFTEFPDLVDEKFPIELYEAKGDGRNRVEYSWTAGAH